MKQLSVLLILIFTCKALALPLPAGAPGGADAAQSPEPLFSNSITELYQYGPGIWSNPGLHSMTGVSIVTKVENDPQTPPVLGMTGLDRNLVRDTSVDLNFPAGVTLGAGPPYPYQANDLYDHFVVTNGGNATADFGPAVSLGIPLPVALSVWLSPVNINAIDPPPAFPGPWVMNFIPHTSTARLGFFSSNASHDDASVNVWVTDYINLYSGLKAAPNREFIHPMSRGKLLLDALGFYNRPNPADNPPNREFNNRHVLSRHNQRFASFRAIGLNPMWDIVNPTTSGAHGAIQPRVSDYILNSTARFFYNESYRHIDAAFVPNALWLLYRTFANMLAYESGHINMRYQPLDPSCRIPHPVLPNTCMPTVLPPQILNAPFLINFGTPNEFALVYDLLKYLQPDPGQAYAAADSIATGGGIGPVSGAVNGRMGVGMPTDMNSLMALAQSIFNAAWNIQRALPANFGGSELLVPRASAAFVIAAAVAGKRVDPVFWGHIAEAEQAIFKIAFANYKNTVDGWFASDKVKNDYALSLSDLGEYRPNLIVPPVDRATSVAFPNSGLEALLRTARDGNSGRMALIRGPAGIMSLQGDRFEVANSYKLPDDTFRGTPFPNPYIEMAQSGRAIIDGDLIFRTNNAAGDFIDLDNNTGVSSAFRLPFDLTVLGSYALDANVVIGGNVAAAVAQGTATRGRSGGGASAIAVIQEEYKVLTGRFRPVSRFSSDSRFFTPALQYWLVISDKLNANGIDPLANINPPQFANIGNMYLPEVTKGPYRLKNLANVSYTDSGTPRAPLAVPAIPNPLGNILPLDAYHHSTNPPYVLNQFPLLVQQSFQRTLEAPFVSPTNDYIPSPVAIPEVNAAGDGIAPAVPASGPGSVDCARLSLFDPARDQTIPCP